VKVIFSDFINVESSICASGYKTDSEIKIFLQCQFGAIDLLNDFVQVMEVHNPTC